MSPLATDATDTYLDVLRTLGVTDAELRRHHGVADDEPLRTAIAAGLETPTDDLLAALSATGRVLDTATESEPEDCDGIVGALARFGYVLECTRVGGDLAIDCYDRVTGDAERVRSEASWSAVLESLATEVLQPVGIEVVPLLDDRTLVVDARRLERLRVAYGPRLQPFETPLLPPEAAGGVPEADGPGVVAGDWAGGAAAAERATASERAAATDATDSDRDVLDADDPGASDDAPTIDALGGGPRRTVSTSGIDDVFDQMEAGADREDAGTVSTTARTDDPLEDWDGPAGDDGEERLAGGGPDRTVSTTSADDLLDRATRPADFDDIAAEHADDPDAVLDDGEAVSELATAVSEVQSDPDVEEPSVDELITAAEESVGGEPAEVLDGDGEEDAIDDPERATEVLDDLGSTIGR